jgi:hypothetical protein
MTLRAIVVRGLAKEVEEDLNKVLATLAAEDLVRALGSESGGYLTVTLIVEEPSETSRVGGFGA